MKEVAATAHRPRSPLFARALNSLPTTDCPELRDSVENSASIPPGAAPRASLNCLPNEQARSADHRARLRIHTKQDAACLPARPPSAPLAPARCALRHSSAALGPREPIRGERSFPPCSVSACRLITLPEGTDGGLGAAGVVPAPGRVVCVRRRPLSVAERQPGDIVKGTARGVSPEKDQSVPFADLGPG